AAPRLVAALGARRLRVAGARVVERSPEAPHRLAPALGAPPRAARAARAARLLLSGIGARGGGDRERRGAGDDDAPAASAAISERAGGEREVHASLPQYFV